MCHSAMEYHKLWLNKSYFFLCFKHLETGICLMHFKLLFPVLFCYCFCRSLWQNQFLFFSPKSRFPKSYMSVVVRKGNNFLVTSYVLMMGPKANQNPLITWCSDLRIIIFHTFQEKSHGLHTWLLVVNHRCPFSDFYWVEGRGGEWFCTQAIEF